MDPALFARPADVGVITGVKAEGAPVLPLVSGVVGIVHAVHIGQTLPAVEGWDGVRTSAEVIAVDGGDGSGV